MRGREWTKEEETYVKENYGKTPAKEIAEKLNRSYNAISMRAAKFGLKSRVSIIWTEEEANFLKENADKLSLKEISGTIGRPYSSTCLFAKRLGLSLKNAHKLWTEEENEKLLAMLSEYKYTYADLEKEFGKSQDAISQHLRMIGTMMRPIPKNKQEERKMANA